ncbi:hypothetical protein GPECTOR_420g276 [Gonium pectorale]|uniref:Pseudouridine synthase RsuA/RluA-like domain-containing protein n=1 Tax=Gonium pectorale TaxID=33097 RepID=A0A150FWD4_GONPE|nr:hypothetical protein GPECTOR_420g276 [Gonium pectorale]|eukprot:KXZ41515.1 hypothetical protein GPECTOR_420g276 [Gonium pectorale]
MDWVAGRAAAQADPRVHRLDAPTGGLLLAAKTHVAHRRLAADLAARRISKRYCALVKGVRSGSGRIDMPLSGKPCVSFYAAVPVPAAVLGTDTEASPLSVANAAAEGAQGAAVAAEPDVAAAGPVAHHVPSARHGTLTKVLLWPRTGRTHQLRKHMAYTGTPILGDPRYRGGRPAGPADPRVGALVEPAGDRAEEGELEAVRRAGAGSEAAAASAGGARSVALRDLATPPGSSAASEASLDYVAPLPEAEEPETEAEREEELEEEEQGEEGWDFHRPPVDAEWALAAAALAAASGNGCAGDLLSDGSTPVSLCLWAVGIRFRHPVTGRRTLVDISGWADAVYDAILRREAATARAAACATNAQPRVVAAAGKEAA